MQAVLITIYLIIVVALIAVILLQRSEGGGLGMGSAGNNGLVSVRGSANLLTRTTAILAALFFVTAIGLTIMSEVDRGSGSILQRAADGVGEGASAPTTVLDALNALSGDTGGDAGLAVPTTEAPAETPATETPAAPTDDAALAVPAAPGDSAAPAAEGQPAGSTAPAAPVN